MIERKTFSELAAGDPSSDQSSGQSSTARVQYHQTKSPQVNMLVNWNDVMEEVNLARSDGEKIVRLDDLASNRSMWQKEGPTQARCLRVALDIQGDARVSWNVLAHACQIRYAIFWGRCGRAVFNGQSVAIAGSHSASVWQDINQHYWYFFDACWYYHTTQACGVVDSRWRWNWASHGHRIVFLYCAG